MVTNICCKQNTSKPPKISECKIIHQDDDIRITQVIYSEIKNGMSKEYILEREDGFDATGKPIWKRMEHDDVIHMCKYSPGLVSILVWTLKMSIVDLVQSRELALFDLRHRALMASTTVEGKSPAEGKKQ